MNPPSFRISGSYEEYDWRMNPALLIQKLRIKAASMPLFGSKEKVAAEERRLKAYAIARAVSRVTLAELSLSSFFSECDKILKL